MATSDLNTTERMRIGGTIAERAFEAQFPHRWFRFGLDQPDWSDGKPVGFVLPRELSSAPDYVADLPRFGPSLIECIGGKGNIIRSVKRDKLRMLEAWQRFTTMPTFMFIWNSRSETWVLVHILNLPNPSAPLKRFEVDGVEYWEHTWDHLLEIGEYL